MYWSLINRNLSNVSPQVPDVINILNDVIWLYLNIRFSSATKLCILSIKCWVRILLRTFLHKMINVQMNIYRPTSKTRQRAIKGALEKSVANYPLPSIIFSPIFPRILVSFQLFPLIWYFTYLFSAIVLPAIFNIKE